MNACRQAFSQDFKTPSLTLRILKITRSAVTGNDSFIQSSSLARLVENKTSEVIRFYRNTQTLTYGEKVSIKLILIQHVQRASVKYDYSIRYKEIQLYV
jgi:hypothetical protein